MSKKPASLSLDLDNHWAYLKTHKDPGWEDFPSYLDALVPHVLDILRKEELRITFLIVGQDAALDKNHDALRALADSGHEIGNHSFHHEPWLHKRSETEIEDELAQAEDAIEAATGVRTRGFRGPGLQLLADNSVDFGAPRLRLRRLHLPDLHRPPGPRLLLPRHGRPFDRAGKGRTQRALRRLYGRFSPLGAPT